MLLRKLIGAAYIRLAGWTLIGERPEAKKYVLVCAPHTSNWDFVYLLAASWAFGTNLNWLGKHTLFEGPMGWFLLKTGGVPVNRHSPQDLVEQLVTEFESKDELHLAIPPSGTRGYREYWKSGFYRIAMQADVPVVMGILDFKAKRTGFGPQFMLTNDIPKDMDRIREIYFGVEAKFPDQQARIRLRVEDPPDEAPAADTAAETAEPVPVTPQQ